MKHVKQSVEGLMSPLDKMNQNTVGKCGKIIVNPVLDGTVTVLYTIVHVSNFDTYLYPKEAILDVRENIQ